MRDLDAPFGSIGTVTRQDQDQDQDVETRRFVGRSEEVRMVGRGACLPRHLSTAAVVCSVWCVVARNCEQKGKRPVTRHSVPLRPRLGLD